MFGRLRSYKYSVIIHSLEYNYTRKENWKECVTWCENTFDKKNYTCDIEMSGTQVYKVIVRFKMKEDYTQFILTWCE